MTDQSDATQADADAQSQADTTNNATQADASETISLEEAKKLRSEATNLRKRLKDAESKVQAIEDAGKSEDEKRTAALKAAEERAATLETRLRDMSARSAVTDAATKSGAISPRAVYALIKSDLEFGDDGEPTNVDALLKQAIKDEPSLFRAANGSGDGGKGGATGTTGNINDVFREMARTAH